MSCSRRQGLYFAVALAVIALTIPAATVTAADKNDETIDIRARAVSALNISRAASDKIDIRITRWTPEDERGELVDVLETKGNHALATALGERDDVGWVQFDPRGGGGPGRDPRRTKLKYARQIDVDDTMEVILITDHYIGYGEDAQAADGSKLSEYPISFVLLKFKKDDKGEWNGVGRIFVGAKIKYDPTRTKFGIDEFPMDPVYLKNVTIR